jgi:phage baseplate assembly protein V
MSDFGLADLERRLANVVRYGTITEVDAANARAKVTFGGETASAWLQFSTSRAGGARVWSPPVTGEQVVVFSPMGDTAQGVIMGSLPNSAFPPPSGDGGTYQIDLPGGVSISVAGGAINISAPGNITVNGDVIANGISLETHLHSGVVPGGSNTGQPVG